MRITAILVLRTPGDAASDSPSPSSTGGEQPAVVLAKASDLSRFGFFKRFAARKFVVSVARTVALSTAAGRRKTVQHKGTPILLRAWSPDPSRVLNPNGLCAVMFTDDHYPNRSAHSILIKVLEEYQKNFGESWRTAKDAATRPWQYLDDALTKYQDPGEANELTKIQLQRHLDETKIIIHKTLERVLQRGELLDSLIAKSSDLTAASQIFYKQPKKTNSCCTIM